MRLDRLIKNATRTRFLVTSVDGDGFDGVLIDSDAAYLVFANAEAIAENGDRLKLDTDLWLPRVRIKYMQVVRS